MPAKHVDAIATWTPADVHTTATVGVLRDGDWNIATQSLGYSTGADAFFMPRKTTPDLADATIMITFLCSIVALMIWYGFKLSRQNEYDVATVDEDHCQYCQGSLFEGDRACPHCGAAV